MARLRKPKTLTLDTDIVERAEVWLKQQPGGGVLARLIDTALEEFLDRQEKQSDQSEE